MEYANEAVIEGVLHRREGEGWRPLTALELTAMLLEARRSKAPAFANFTVPTAIPESWPPAYQPVPLETPTPWPFEVTCVR